MKKISVLILALVAALEGPAQGLLNRNSLLNRRTAAGQNTSTASSSTGAVRPATTSSSGAQGTAAPGASKVDVGGRSIEFNGAALDIVLMVYGNLVGKTVLKDPAAPAAAITLQPKQGQELSDEDKILAIETVLEMNGVHLEPYGEKFVRALPRGTVRKDGVPLILDPDAELGETTKVVSIMLSFRNIALDEAQKALEGLKSDKGVLNVFERTNSILVTDTEMIVNRMREIIRAIDVETPVTEKVEIYQIKHAAASEIQKVLQGVVDDAKKILEKQGKNAGQAQSARTTSSAPRTLLNRPGQNNPAPAPAAGNDSLFTAVSDADRGMIRGETLLIADERSNKLIIKTQPSNLTIFKRLIDELDIETTPDTVVKVYRLKYADAEDVSSMINDLIGNAPSGKSNAKGNQNAAAKSSGSTGKTDSAPKSANQRTGDAKAGELSKENTTVLADKRINGLVVMTAKDLVPVVEQIIESMDIKLSQVLIETCIIEVGLGDNISTGIDWVHGLQKEAVWGKDADGVPVVKSEYYTSALGGGGGDAKAIAGVATNALFDVSTKALPSIFAPGTAGLSYALFSQKFNLGAIIQASKTDSHSKYLASPVVMTVDNKEATIEATESRKFYSGSTSSGSTGYSSVSYNYSDKDLGIKIKVTPKINPNGTVMLQVEEEYSQVMEKNQEVLVSSGSSSGSPSHEKIDTALVRKMSADVILENGQSVVLGGLTEKVISESESGIPILKDIPFIGKYLFGSTSYKEGRKELLVFMTPYVLNDADEAEKKAEHLKKALSEARPWDDNGWSESKLADPVSKKEQLKRQRREWKKEDAELDADYEIEKAQEERVAELIARAEAREADRARRKAEREEEEEPAPLDEILEEAQ